MAWTVAALRAIHAWRQSAHTRFMRRHEDEPDAGRIVEELISGLASTLAERAETIATEDGAKRVTANHVDVAAQQVNLRVRVTVERGLRQAA